MNGLAARRKGPPQGNYRMASCNRRRVLLKCVLRLRLDVVLTPFGELLWGEVVDRKGVGIGGDSDEERNAPTAPRPRPQAFGHSAGLLGLGAPAEVDQLSHGHAVTVADFVVGLHNGLRVYPEPGHSSLSGEEPRPT